MGTFTEKVLVEDYLLGRLQEKSWRFVHPGELERESMEEPLLTSFPRLIQCINQELGLSNEDIRLVTNEIKLKSSGIEGTKALLYYFKNGLSHKTEKKKEMVRVQLFDYDTPDRNDFVVSKQVVFKSGNGEIRADLVLFVNGVPLVIIECKNPVSLGVDWEDGYQQVKKYEKIVPELFKYVQIGCSAGQTGKYFPIVPWEEDNIEIQEWKSEGKDSLEGLSDLLAPGTLLDIIKNFLFFRVKQAVTTKVLPRYVQYRATNKIVNRVLDNLAGRSDKNKGLIWHWQGSGKTFTMLFAGYKLFFSRQLENPSIFYIVDRDELEQQISEEFGFLPDFPVAERISSVDNLKQVIVADDYRGKRGIFLTLIHKFRPEELNQLSKVLKEVSIQKSTLMTRKNVICFIDEGHRTQYGLLSGQMKEIFQKSFFFAFTGTPIAKKGRDTYKEFSYPPEEDYLDAYLLRQSEEEGLTVPIAYQARLEKNLHLSKEQLTMFWKGSLEEIPEELKDTVEEKLKKKLNRIILFLENPERIRKIAVDIARHFKDNFDGRFKGMVVAGSRKSCVLYKREFDNLLGPDYSEAVISYSLPEKPEITEYFNGLVERFGVKDAGSINDRLVENYKNRDFPRLIIVTDMLLTGFDVPELGVMYLDKPLKEHRLLQAVARTNRPFREVKFAGLVVDYVGILKELNRVLTVYNEEDIRGVLCDFEQLKQDFTENLEKCLGFFPEAIRGVFDRTGLLEAVEIISSDEEINRDFLSLVKSLRLKFEYLGPDTIKVNNLTEYKWIMAIYTYYLKMKEGSDEVGHLVEKYFPKMVQTIYQSLEIAELKKNLPVIQFDEKYIDDLLSKSRDKREQVMNIVFLLNRMVIQNKGKNPIYESVADKVERILNMWKDKNKNYELMLKEVQNAVQEIKELTKLQKKLGLSDGEYAVYLILKKKITGDMSVEEVRGLSARIGEKLFPGWQDQKLVVKEVEKEIRKFLFHLHKKKYDLDTGEIDTLSQQIKENVEKYGNYYWGQKNPLE